MSDKDINIHIRAKETEQTERKLDQVADSTKKVGDKSREGARGVDEFGKSTRKAEGSLTGFLKKFAGFFSITAAIGAATAAIREQTRALNENAEAANRQQNALLRLQFLGDYYKEKPELRKEVASMAEYGRRPFEEVANAAYNLRSKNAAMSEQQRMGILREALEMGRTDPSLPLDTLVDMFSLYGKQSGVADANRIQNVLQQTITEAGGSGADVAAYMPRFLPIGMAGGLTPAQTAGLWAYGTTQEAEASVATTGLRAIMMGLQGKGSPEGAKLLKNLGVTQDMSFFEKIATLSSANIDLATAETLFQREGATMGLNLLKDPAAMMRTIGQVTGADRGDIDLTRNKIEGLLGTDEVARMEEQNRMMDVRIENQKAGDHRAAKYQLQRKEYESLMRDKGISEARIGLFLKEADLVASLGLDPFVFNEEIQQKSYASESDGVAAGNSNITFDNSVHYHRNERPATTRTGDLN